MTITFHSTAVLPLIGGLKNLSHVLTKGEKHALAASIDPSEYISTRLAPDMDPLPQQIYRATDSAKFLVSRITGLPGITLEDNQTTFAEFQARITTVITYLESIDPAAFEGAEENEVIIYTRGPPGSGLKNEITFQAKDYVVYYAHPNFWFHVVTAYAILRHKGVDVGKMDYLNGVGLIKAKQVPAE